MAKKEQKGHKMVISTTISQENYALCKRSNVRWCDLLALGISNYFGTNALKTENAELKANNDALRLKLRTVAIYNSELLERLKGFPKFAGGK